MNCEGCLNKTECEGCANHVHVEKVTKDKYFHVGEVVALKGRVFKVKGVKPNELRLKLVKGL